MNGDMSVTIVPRSDQKNADDLISGPLTIKVTEVRITAGDQPVSIDYAGSDGRPYKPCKSMRRILVEAWGNDSAAYIGRSMTLVRDPTVRFGKDEVGGIRISHLSHIDGPMRVALTVTKGKRAPYSVQPLVGGPAAPPKQRRTKAEATADAKKAADVIVDEINAATTADAVNALLTKHGDALRRMADLDATIPENVKRAATMKIGSFDVPTGQQPLIDDDTDRRDGGNR